MKVDNELIAADARSQEITWLARRVATTEATVMITGESGVGKEVIAHYIHRHSGRKDAPFVAINCAAIPENMLESALFGYEKGAFTGAHQSHAGKFEQAQGGTLLLDEITEMDTGLQAKLLRVLQEREVERLGGRKVIPLDVRVIATSNRELHRMVKQGEFREDLYYRLNVFPMYLYPLRARREDILPLAFRFMKRYADDDAGVELSQAAAHILWKYSWPGNVRELDNVIQRALILKTDNSIEAGDIRFEAVAGLAGAASDEITHVQGEAEVEGLNGDLWARERELIMTALKSGNSRKETAEQLGISPRTLRYKLARMRDAGMAIPA